MSPLIRILAQRVLLSRRTNRNYYHFIMKTREAAFLFQKYISEIMLIELTRKKHACRVSNVVLCSLVTM